MEGVEQQILDSETTRRMQSFGGNLIHLAATSSGTPALHLPGRADHPAVDGLLVPQDAVEGWREGERELGREDLSSERNGAWNKGGQGARAAHGGDAPGARRTGAQQRRYRMRTLSIATKRHSRSLWRGLVARALGRISKGRSFLC
eukprot:132654-Hanusia_phi.AAC.2